MVYEQGHLLQMLFRAETRVRKEKCIWCERIKRQKEVQLYEIESNIHEQCEIMTSYLDIEEFSSTPSQG